MIFKLFGIGVAVFVLLAAPAFVQAVPLPELTGAAFVPNPKLRIVVQGLAGTDGYSFTINMVTAKFPGEPWVTQATTTLKYTSINNEVSDGSNNLNVIRYEIEKQGIFRQAVVERMPGETGFWLPGIIKKDVQWDVGKKHKIMATNLTVNTPAGRFERCVMLERDVYAARVGIMREYFAPSLGLIKSVAVQKSTDTQGTVWDEIQRVEDIDEEQALSMIEQVMAYW